MGVNQLPQDKIAERTQLLLQVRNLVLKESFIDDPEAFALWLDLLRILSYRAQQSSDLGAPLRSVFSHFNRKFELDFIESQWDLIERLGEGCGALVAP